MQTSVQNEPRSFDRQASLRMIGGISRKGAEAQQLSTLHLRTFAREHSSPLVDIEADRKGQFSCRRDGEFNLQAIIEGKQMGDFESV